VHADSLMACSLFHQGKFTSALERAEHGLGMYAPERHRELLAPYGENPSMACQAWAALCLWFLGFPDRAAERALRLVSFGETPDHCFALSTATLYAMHVYQLRKDRQEASRWADRTLSLAEAQGYLYNIAFARVVRGWASVEGGAAASGLESIQSGLTLASTIGAKLDQPYLLALAAEAQFRCGQYSAARTSIAEALSLVKASRAFFYEAELYRLRAMAGLEQKTRNASADAMNDLRLALDVAGRQGARSLELRIATDLARLLAAEGKSSAARKLLAPLHANFEEGFGTEDLRQASDLLTLLER
jgi:adenylate cyclase